MKRNWLAMLLCTYVFMVILGVHPVAAATGYTWQISADRFNLPEGAIYPVVFFPLHIKVEPIVDSTKSDSVQCTAITMDKALSRTRTIINSYFALPARYNGINLNWKSAGCNEAANVLFTTTINNRTITLNVEKKSYNIIPVLDGPLPNNMVQQNTQLIETIAVAPVRIQNGLGLLIVTNNYTSQLIWSIGETGEWHFALTGGTPQELIILAEAINSSLNPLEYIMPVQYDPSKTIKVVIRAVDKQGKISVTEIVKQGMAWSCNGKLVDANKVTNLMQSMLDMQRNLRADRNEANQYGFYPAANSWRVELIMKDGIMYQFDIGATKQESFGWFALKSNYARWSTTEAFLINDYKTIELLAAILSLQ